MLLGATAGYHTTHTLPSDVLGRAVPCWDDISHSARGEIIALDFVRYWQPGIRSQSMSFLLYVISDSRRDTWRASTCDQRTTSAVVFLKPSNRQRSTCSCHGFDTSARASGELYLAPDGHRGGVTGINHGSTRSSCGVHPGRAHVSDCTCDSDRDWRRHE